MRKIALYDPYLDTLGGGERYILSILKVLEDLDYEVSVFWDTDLSQAIEQRFNIKFKQLTFLPNIFKNKSFPFSTLKTLQTLQPFNLFFYMTDGSYFFSTAKKTFVYAMVPKRELYPHKLQLLDRLKTNSQHFITHSQFVANFLNKWGIKSQVIYPYIDNNFFVNQKSIKKEKIILSVGRFFGHLHSKQHKTIIKVFLKFVRSHKNPEFSYKLILAGGLKDEDRDYFQSLQKLTKGNPQIELRPNLSFDELDKLYKPATFYWHFTGYGVDGNEHPELVEHLGITPLEAMAAGCITFCYNAGGPKELIADGVNGFLFNNEEELEEKLVLSIKNQVLREKIIYNAQKFVKDNFSYAVFREKVKDLIA